MPRVMHFEIETRDPEQTIAFYENVFSWQFRKVDVGSEYWLITTGDAQEQGINGGLMRGDAERLRTMNTIEVPAIQDFIAKVEGAGGKAITPVMEIPGVGLFAYCTDPQGIQFGIIQGS